MINPTLIPSRNLSGSGPFSQKCRSWLEEHFQAPLVILTPSCTAALEMGLLLKNINPGDEVIVPSYTFSSTASAIVLLGGVPVFVDSQPGSLNLDPRAVEHAITSKTRGIIPMHYGGVGCDMEKIENIAQKHGLFIFEDAAQCMGATLNGKKLGTFGDIAAFSFHHTKNISCGEGGCLVINDPNLTQRAEIIRDKGTNRSSFFKGQVDKYTWIDKGSSYLMSDLQAEYLLQQLIYLEDITQNRLETWNIYFKALAPLEKKGILERMNPPKEAQHNAHLFYILLETPRIADTLRETLAHQGISLVSHYAPLHKSQAGKKYGRTAGEIQISSDRADRLLRLPLEYGMDANKINTTIDAINHFFES